MEHSLFFSFFIIFSGAAILATLSLYTHQPIIIAYVALGIIAGPSVMGWVSDAQQLSEIAHIGIVFLLFLLGLDMQPKSLAHVLKKASLVALASSCVFFAAGYGAALAFGFSQTEALVTGAALMFSSTIIGIKLLPTTVLHHKHMGELMVGLLLLQDMIAIIVLLVLGSASSGGGIQDFALTALALPCLIVFSYVCVKFVILPLLVKFDLFHEYLFLMAIGWCLGLAELGAYLGLSKEMGAFVAGITLATHPVAQFMTEKLKPIRDFFLVLFFFTLGAGFKLHVLADIWLYAIILSAIVLIIKPVAFKLLLGLQSENSKLSWDIGFRLGQISEFSLLIAYLAIASNLIGENAAHTIQATAVITFIVSTYIVIFKYPNPIAPSSKLRRD
ncbi:cation:proton antiporter [Bermanella sp. WJH001]|mgnify:CR=1 FL=1|uniref:cation:proton antiporter n=1 Tax=Bermanella sp. WJH001 TaxID=3048005 RepID=UPI0024BE6D13|nr:cation:proton antiporter [Bermanella sp. WJH001]MDJ1537082.1 cation:proton antiporter [Bermanella sp. WJH001]